MQNLIKESGLTNKQFAELYKIPYNTVLQWAKGIRQAPEYLTNIIKQNRELKTKGIQLEIDLPTKQPKYVYCFINEEHQIPLRMRIFTDSDNVLEAYKEERYSMSEERIKEEYKNNNVYRYTLSCERKIK